MPKTLIVDDSAIFRKLLKETLHSRYPSMEIVEAADGVEAMQKINSYHPDLIFMDIRLPGETGLKLTQKIKRVLPQTNIIILTNYDLPEYREAASKFAANHFLSKGVTTGDQISTIVESIIAHAGIHEKNLVNENIQNGEA